ncbi:hypothetical protein C0Q70_09681 [Pomacea canaliculata]|uniref:Uncharacterized protein n=1 Tax=Pomacea canaliculata TaxID=400727 RepID=A0A2T7PAG6_POMCA|nr:hypothetical protein C0Q70_09681 [Pomacea canaliculata]
MSRLCHKHRQSRSPDGTMTSPEGELHSRDAALHCACMLREREKKKLVFTEVGFLRDKRCCAAAETSGSPSQTNLVMNCVEGITRGSLPDEVSASLGHELGRVVQRPLLVWLQGADVICHRPNR